MESVTHSRLDLTNLRRFKSAIYSYNKKSHWFFYGCDKLVYANATVKSKPMKDSTNDLTVILTQALNEMKMELGDKFDLEKVNLADLERRTGDIGTVYLYTVSCFISGICFYSCSIEGI